MQVVVKPLCVIPTYVTTREDVTLVGKCLRSLRDTARDTVDVLVVDDGSPEPELVTTVQRMAAKQDAAFEGNLDNEGFASTVNHGLERARDEGRDAILVNADIQFTVPGWALAMHRTHNMRGPGDAWVVGGLLTYASGLIQHGGIYLSELTRSFDHYWKYAPSDLPEAHTHRVCPVTGALQFIRHEALTSVGLYDDTFKMGFEDVDYCIRVLLAKQECVFNPMVRAIHHESMFRGRRSEKLDAWHHDSAMRLATKWSHINFASMVPTWE